MPPKKDASKAKGKGKAGNDTAGEGASKLKAAQSINVRHILVWISCFLQRVTADRDARLVRKTLQEGRSPHKAARGNQIR
jgi:hypothetical protein